MQNKYLNDYDFKFVFLQIIQENRRLRAKTQILRGTFKMEAEAIQIFQSELTGKVEVITVETNMGLF